MDRILLNEVVAFDFTVSEVIFWSYCTCNVGIAAVLLLISYRLLRPKLPARVNCWFCNKNALVPYNDRDCWNCPFCDQYNGFTRDGDYNKDIHKLMHIQSTPENATSGKERSNGLCDRCNVNQQLKIQQLARFSPMNDDNYDEEIDHFRTQLDKSYRLCPPCEKVLSQTLQSQHYSLLANRMNDHRSFNDGMPIRETVEPTDIKKRFGFALKLTSLGLLLSIISSSSAIVAGDVSSEWLPTSLSNICQNFITYLIWMGGSLKEISAVGAGTYLLSHFLHPSRHGEISFLIWLTISALSWTEYVSIILAVALINLFLQGGLFRKPTVCFKKIDLPKKAKMNFPVTPIFETLNISQPPLQEAIVKSLEKQVEADKTSEVAEDVLEKPKTPKKRIEAHKIQLSNRMLTRSQSAMREELLSKEDVKNNKRERLYSPPPEVYDAFNNLRLDTETPTIKESKPGPQKKWNGILKPTKFLGDASPPIGLDDFDLFRSSTPSSSSSRPITKEPDRMLGGKSTPDMRSYSCNKISPLVNKFTPPCSYGIDYNDFNVMNNVHPGFYSNGYTPPYQVFPGPMGQTTVYTYTRPSSFPYGFPPQRFTPPYEYSSPLSPRLSEVGSSTHSLSGNQFSSQPISDKWCWVKRVFYAASIMFNIVSVSVLLVSYWYGTFQMPGK